MPKQSQYSIHECILNKFEFLNHLFTQRHIMAVKLYTQQGHNNFSIAYITPNSFHIPLIEFNKLLLIFFAENVHFQTFHNTHTSQTNSILS